MVAVAGEPSTKRAKADEEEDPLVRRKEEVVRLLEESSAKGKGNARAKEELLTLCARLEAKNEKLLGRLLPELWQKIVDEYLQQNDLLALAMTCRFFRETTKDLGKKVETDLTSDRLIELRKSGRMPSHTLAWFRWVCDTMEILPGTELDHARIKGAVYEDDLVNYAVFQGSVEILRWLVEEKGWKLNGGTSFWAGFGGSVKILEYASGRGYKFNGAAYTGAASGGCLEALKFLTGREPPRDGRICGFAAREGHLDVLKWLRAQEPPCPWGEWTCKAAAEAGHLEVLKWLRAQSPPCPWEGWGGSRRECREKASKHGHEHIVKWIDQQEDESEVEYSDFEMEWWGGEETTL
ncbi:hypothetical protein HKI87_13g74250 [Chloropicon roscoffensis]|uniref:Uncharacterized protein n=1 Tax=Chloropicon roscoffensis TaxID=1461544 RepID=A0AAX4PJ05_9CHLO